MKKIELTLGKFSLVDDEDYIHLSKHKWYAQKRGRTYRAARNAKSNGIIKSINIHRLVLGLKEGDGYSVDHIDGDGLNNQKCNLRKCDTSENMRNRGRPVNNKSGYKGVSWCRKGKKWRSQIQIHGISKSLGYYNCLIKAAKAYDQGAIEYHGEFACLNFP